MPGCDYKIPLADLFEASKQHQAGWSLRALSRMNWERWGYASPNSAMEGLRNALKTIDAPVRDRIVASVLATTFHGHNTRQARTPGHPDHKHYLAHRRWLGATRRHSHDEDEVAVAVGG